MGNPRIDFFRPYHRSYDMLQPLTSLFMRIHIHIYISKSEKNISNMEKEKNTDQNMEKEKTYQNIKKSTNT